MVLCFGWDLFPSENLHEDLHTHSTHCMQIILKTRFQFPYWVMKNVLFPKVITIFNLFTFSGLKHYKPQARFSGDCDVQRRNLRIFLKGEAPSLLCWTKGYITSRDPEPILKLSTMFVLLSNLSSSTLNPVYLKWTPNLVAIHVHCRKHNII